MIEIDMEDISPLMRQVSLPLRRNWEKTMIGGRDLAEVIATREAALTRQRGCSRNSKITLAILFPTCAVSACWAVVLASQWHGWTFKFAAMLFVAGASFVAAMVNPIRLSEKSNKAWQQIDACNQILAMFKASVDALNPLRTGNSYYDLITVDTVVSRTIGFTYKVVSAEDDFERLMKPRAVRLEVMHAVHWIDKCNEWLTTILTAATVDFALPLTREEVFEKAIEEFTEREGRRPAHLAN